MIANSPKGGVAVIRSKIGAKIEVSILPSPRLLINLEPGLHVEFKSAVGVNTAFHTYLDTSTNNEYDTQLYILRLADEEIILSLPSTETIIDFENIPGSMWSPTSDRLIYQDKQDNWQIIQVPEGNQISITLNGGARLSFPQWSSDGQYLSLTVRSETERGIVILRIP